MQGLVLLGPPGSGKGTHAARITHSYGIPAVSTGDALREQLAIGSPLGMRAKVYMDAGKLVPDEIIDDLVEDLFEKRDMEKGFLFDGFPRTVEQAKALDGFLAKKGKRLDTVLFLNVPKDVLIERIAGRRVCPACGDSYNLGWKDPEAEGICDLCGTRLIRREDDEPGTVEKRVAVYNEQTSPLIEYYSKQGILIEIDGAKEVDERQKQIDKLLKEQDDQA